MNLEHSKKFMNQFLPLDKFSFGMGDRFGRQGRAATEGGNRGRKALKARIYPELE